MRNSRFWVYVNHCYAKITLEPGQHLSWSQGGETDEGWSAAGERWTLSRDGLALEREWFSDGVDCDGRLSRGGEFIASADPFTFEQCAPATQYFRPAWEEGHEYRRDYTAIRANY